MSSVPARYEVSGERRNPKPSGSTSRVPPPKMASPLRAWFLSSAKISSCLRMRFAPSTSFLVAMSSSSDTWRFFRSDKCIEDRCSVTDPSVEEGEDSTPASGTSASNCCWGAGRRSPWPPWRSPCPWPPWRLREKFGGLDMAVNERCELGFGKSADLGRFHGTVLEEHQGRYAADAVLRWRRLVFVDVQ